MSDPVAFQNASLISDVPRSDGGASARPLYRVDRFIVPAEARDEFLARVRDTHAILRRQEGFIRDLILEQQSGPGSFNLVTVVEWANEDVIGQVSEAVAKHHAAIGFDRNETLARLGITADIANYAHVAAA
jgi:heme-degrading monooxygenase HmoA